jgi:hypothetical protein
MIGWTWTGVLAARTTGSLHGALNPALWWLTAPCTDRIGWVRVACSL